MASAEGPPQGRVRTRNHFVPYAVRGMLLLQKIFEKSTEKAWRGYSIRLKILQRLGIPKHGYPTPKTRAGKMVDFRVAMNFDDLDDYEGAYTHHFLYRWLREKFYFYWFGILLSLPYLIYQYCTGYWAWKVAYHLCTLDTSMLTAHHHALPILFVLQVLGWMLNGFFGWEQEYRVFRVDAQAAETIMCEIHGATQEKTSADAIASAPASSRVMHECRETCKKMPHMQKMAYMHVVQMLTAAWALGVAELNDPASALVTGRSADAVELIPLLEDSDGGNDTDPDMPEIFKKPTVTDEVQMKDRNTMRWPLLLCRTCTTVPKELRDSVEVKERTPQQLKEDRERGKSVKLPDDDHKKIDFSGVVFTPEIIKIIAGLESNKENEWSGVNRHFIKLEHPLFKGEYLKKPTPEAQRRLNRSADFIAEHMNEMARKHLVKICQFSPPTKWSQSMKDEMPEMAQQTSTRQQLWSWCQRKLSGFVKKSELQLPEGKNARLIGNLGPVANMEDAMSIAPIENLLKVAYKTLITKGLTLDECDEAIVQDLLKCRREGRIPHSEDLSAMDSSVTKMDRINLRKIAEAVLKPVRDALTCQLRNYDHVLDADEHKKKLKMQLNYITVILDADDSILFSGERMTSLFNRLLILTIEGAEDIKFLGEEEGRLAIRATLDGMRRTTRGDGDDNLQQLIARRYATQEERICAYADYFKKLDPCSSWDEKTDAEVLSRFHIWCGELFGYAHIGKLERNLGRLIGFKIQRCNLPDDQKDTELSQAELAMICTDVWQRIISLKQTMVVRHFARATFEYAFSKLTDKSIGTVYDDDMKRLGREDGDHSLRDCLTQIYEVLSETKTSAYAMVKVSNFKNFSQLSKQDVEEQIAAWEAADYCWSTMQFDDKHVLYPQSLIEDFPIAKIICRHLGMIQSCIDMGTELPARVEKAKEKPKGTLILLANALEESLAGKLADVTGPSRTGGAESSSSDSRSNPEEFSLCHDDTDAEDDAQPLQSAGDSANVTIDLLLMDLSVGINGTVCGPTISADGGSKGLEVNSGSIIINDPRGTSKPNSSSVPEELRSADARPFGMCPVTTTSSVTEEWAPSVKQGEEWLGTASLGIASNPSVSLPVFLEPTVKGAPGLELPFEAAQIETSASQTHCTEPAKPCESSRVRFQPDRLLVADARGETSIAREQPPQHLMTPDCRGQVIDQSTRPCCQDYIDGKPNWGSLWYDPCELCQQRYSEGPSSQGKAKGKGKSAKGKGKGKTEGKPSGTRRGTRGGGKGKTTR